MKEVYHPKQKDEDTQKMEIDSERSIGNDIIQIRKMSVSIGDDGKTPFVVGNMVKMSMLGTPAANDYDAINIKSKEKYFLPQWSSWFESYSEKKVAEALFSRKEREVIGEATG